MSTLAVVEEILRETAVPMSVKEIVERAGSRLPSKSKTPDTVVARDLSMDIKKKGDGSAFIRTSPGRYTMRDLWRRTNGATSSANAGNGATVATIATVTPPSTSVEAATTSVLASAMRQDRAAPLPIRPGAPVGDDKSTVEASRSSG